MEVAVVTVATWAVINLAFLGVVMIRAARR